MSSFTPHRSGPRDGFSRTLRAEWTTFRSARGWVLAVAASVLVTVSLGLLIAGGVHSACVTGKGEGPCPAPLVGPDGTAVSDKYYFVHQTLKGNGGITARVSDMTGQIRLPDAVPGVRNIKEGVVPWAKAGLLVRQSLEQGTPYAAVMLTGDHGVRMQYNYVHDVPGGPHNGPQWLRLTRSGDTVTGYESDDGKKWTVVGTARLAGLPETVEIGMFATSPGALWDMAQAFAQATATFDQIEPQGANGPWRRDDVGAVMESDGRTPHHPGGVVESGDKLIVTGSGDIGPATVEGGLRADLMLIGGAVGLIPMLVAAVTFLTTGHRRGLVGPSAEPRPARVLAAKAAVVGAVAFVAGLVTSGVVVPAGLAMLRANQNPIQPITPGTELRVIVGYAALTSAAAVLALGLAALVRRAVVAVGLAVALVVVPYLLATAGLAPWLLMITPAAGFAITQSVPTFAHVDVGPSLLGGYYPLPPWAGLAVTCGYAALALGAATAMYRRGAPR
ncbi:hypothetical protein [Streptosporangium saharense]|uniref:DUF1349 domain-containing protein n=1 Tax=Streptosporangium saharense TaxID=1706840 RepID=A0A7W7QJS8_9ACTN|nr:hypothetical protein [Streptosporangium saharense]MBB4914885.1 hypothetical protein [Streptosporangium saharense]